MKAFCFRFLRRLLCLLFLPLFCLAFSITVAAEEDAASAGSSLDELYEEQLEASGADELWNSLPNQTKTLLDTLGITQFNADSFSSLTPEGITDSLLALLTEQAALPLRTAGILLGVVLLYALWMGCGKR